MTTIVYKDGIIAYDSRSSQGSYIADDDHEKRTSYGGREYFLTGAVSDHHHMIDADHGNFKGAAGSVEVGAFIWDGARLWEAGFEDGKEFWKAPRRLDRCYALGSGTHHAITAMDCGLSAVDAVKMAMKRDSGTGGKIRMFKIKRNLP